MKECREYPRYTCNLKANFETDKGVEAGDVRNLSSGGFYLATETLLEAGRTFTIEIDLPEKRAWIKGTCEVAWVNDIETKDVSEWIYNSKILKGISPCQLFKGIGVKFIDIPQDQRVSLEKYLSHLKEE